MQKQFNLFLRIIFFIYAVILASGCAGRPVIPDYPSTEKALFSLSNTVSETDILSGVAQIELITPGGYYPAKAILFVKKPSYLRLELIPPVGPPDFYLVATPHEMKILLPSKGEYYQGKPTGRNLSHFLPAQLNIEDIVSILTCSPHLAGKVDYTRNADEKNLRIKMKNQYDISQTAWIRPDGRLEMLEHFDANGKLLYRVKFSDYFQGGLIAGKIAINKDRLTSIIIKYSDIKIEEMKDPSIFDLSIPPGFKKITLD